MGRDLSCSSEHPSPVALGWLGVSGWVPQEPDSETEVRVGLCQCGFQGSDSNVPDVEGEA